MVRSIGGTYAVKGGYMQDRAHAATSSCKAALGRAASVGSSESTASKKARAAGISFFCLCPPSPCLLLPDPLPEADTGVGKRTCCVDKSKSSC